MPVSGGIAVKREADMKHEVLVICTAYEQGYGMGYDRRKLQNPYKKGTDGWQAWDYGYSEGNRKWLTHSMRKIDDAKCSGPVGL